jgi:hypothetical protein
MLEPIDDVQQGEMRPWYYTPVHPATRLSPEEVNILVEWAQSQSCR